jgi:hypothetical protein
MKPTGQGNQDEPLHDALKDWRCEASLPPRFQEQVWRRIELADARPTGAKAFREALSAWLPNLAPRPALSVTCAVALLVVGAMAGWVEARLQSARINDALRLRYVQQVDPYQTNP